MATSSITFLACLASLVGKIAKIEIVVDPKANTAATNGLKVFWPVWDMPIGATVGLMLHEVAGHCVHTDFEYLKSKRKRTKLFFALHNAIEDVRIERAVWSMWPGARKSLMEIGLFVFKPRLHTSKTAIASAPLEALLLDFVLMHGRSQLLDQRFLCIRAALMRDGLENRLGAQTVEAIEQEIGKVASAQTGRAGTSEVGLIVERIMAIVNDRLNALSESRDDGAAAAEDGSANEKRNVSQEGHATGDHKNRLDEDAQLDAADLLKIVEQNCGNPTEYNKEDFQQNRKHDERTSHRRRVPVLSVPAEVKNVAKEGLRALEEALDASTLARVTHRDSGHSVDMGRATRLQMGSLTVFKHLSRGHAVDCAVMFLVDVSGSMQVQGEFSGHSRQLWAQATMAEAIRVLDNADVPFGVAQFGTGGAIACDFGERWDPAIRATCDRSTDLPAGLRASFATLVARREAKKLLFVLTDGDTTGADDCVNILTQPIFDDVEVVYLQLKASTALAKKLVARRCPNIHVAAANDAQQLVTELSAALRAVTLKAA